MFFIKNYRGGFVRLFYKEAMQLAGKTAKVHEEYKVITVKKETTQDYELNVVRLQLALRQVYEEGYQKGLIEGMNHTKKMDDESIS